MSNCVCGRIIRKCKCKTLAGSIQDAQERIMRGIRYNNSFRLDLGTDILEDHAEHVVIELDHLTPEERKQIAAAMTALARGGRCIITRYDY